jgi:CubicO group peptidase (beta-lactamase class C family)
MKDPIKLLALLSLLLFLWANSYGQNKGEKKLAATLDDLISTRLTAIAPGGVVLIAKKGHIIYQKSFGLSDLESGIPMKPAMIFRIGSITKQFTAIAILQLVEQGKISLQDSIQKYITGYPFKGYTITIENLLTQTSGIKDYMAISKPTDDKKNYTPGEGVDYFKDEPLEFKPGSQFKYSNSNYYLLGYIIEIVSGKSYADYLQQNIFTKAGLHNTYYIGTTKNRVNLSQGYSRFDGKLERATFENVTTLYAAGGIMSNASDLWKWHQALYNHELVSQERLARAFTPYRFTDGTYSEYGYGWFIKTLDGSKTIEHSGSTDGFQSDEIYLPHEDVFVVTLFNCFEQDMDWTVLSNDIAKLAIGKPLDNDIQLSADVLERYAGTYVFKAGHTLLVTLENGKLFIEDTNPNDRLPKVQLHAQSDKRFYIKEAGDLQFEFVTDPANNSVKIVTYNSRGKDAEWIRTR